MPTRPLSPKDREVLEKLRQQLSTYFSEDLGSRNRALKVLGVHHSTLDKAFQSGSIQVSFLSQILDLLGRSFEDLCFDALNFESRLAEQEQQAEESGTVAVDEEPPFLPILDTAERRLRELGIEDQGDE